MSTATETEKRPVTSTATAKTPLDPEAAKRAAWALYLIVFTSGAGIMGMEIAGAKVLAPGFGTSTFVWGSIIGLFMGAMAAGYYIGGSIADQRPSFTVLATIVSVGGLFIALIPRFGPTVSDYVARMDMGPVLGPLFAATAIFFLPSFLLAMVSVYAIKLHASSLSGLGSVAGRLYALSTFGSIIGTLATTFLLIPKMFVSNVLQSIGIGLIVVAVVSLVIFRTATSKLSGEDRTGVGLMGLIALLCIEAWIVLPIVHPLPPGARLLHYEDSAYHEILVIEDVIQRRDDTNDFVLMPVRMWEPDRKQSQDEWWLHEVKRWLKFNDNTESGVHPFRAEYKQAVGYTDLLHLPLIWVNEPPPKKMLVVGGGGGVIPTQYALWYGTHVDVAEIDGAVERVAREYFRVPDTDLIKFYIDDGRQVVRKAKDGEYDVIVLDAYSSGGQIPFHLMTWEFMSEVRAKLSPRGVLITNIISAVKNLNPQDIPPAALFLAEYQTLSASRTKATGLPPRTPDDDKPLFSQLYVFPKVQESRPLTGNSYEDYRNVIIVATREENRMTKEAMEATMKSLTRPQAPVVKAPNMTWHIDQLYVPRDEDLKDVPAMHDNYAPVDTMYRPVRKDETSRRLYWY